MRGVSAERNMQRGHDGRSGGAMAEVTTAAQEDPDSERLRELKLTCMANLLSATEERVYFKDLESRFLFISAGWLAAYAPGRSARELIGKTDFDVFSYQHAADAFADEQHIIQTGKPIAGQVERETYTGRPDAWVSTTKMPLLDDDGQIIGTFGISRDVTAQVSAERTLARQASELSAQNEQLRELDRLKDEFIAAVSHELRTPLTSIIGYIELLEEEGVNGPNTGQFTGDGGTVEVSVGEADGQAVLTVTDNGPGIPAADQERIFERFYRTAAAAKRVIPGTGLGLAIAKGIVEAHHGTITVDSAEGRG